jgi:hypothetical protein
MMDKAVKMYMAVRQDIETGREHLDAMSCSSVPGTTARKAMADSAQYPSDAQRFPVIRISAVVVIPLSEDMSMADFHARRQS